MTLKQSSVVHIQALYSADGILPGSSFKLRLLVINLASVPGRQLVNSQTAQSPDVVGHFMRRYIKRQWDDSTGEDLTDSWGASTYLIEIDDEFYALRQIQIFEDGHVLKYSVDFTEDEFGMLSDQPLDIDEFEQSFISEKEFIDTWQKFERKVK